MRLQENVCKIRCETHKLKATDSSGPFFWTVAPNKSFLLVGCNGVQVHHENDTTGQVLFPYLLPETEGWIQDLLNGFISRKLSLTAVVVSDRK